MLINVDVASDGDDTLPPRFWGNSKWKIVVKSKGPQIYVITVELGGAGDVVCDVMMVMYFAPLG